MSESTTLERAINDLWQLCMARLAQHVNLQNMPADLGHLVRLFAEKRVKKQEVVIVKSAKLSDLPKETKTEAEVLLKLFDCSSNGYVSVANVLLEYIKFQHEIENDQHEIAISSYASVDGLPLYSSKAVKNDERCPICNRFPQEVQSFALISGNPQTDSLFQTYRKGDRVNMKICRYCFTAGLVDLPTAKIVKRKDRSISKNREYLFITTPLAHKELEDLLRLIEQSTLANIKDEDNDQTERNNATIKPDLSLFLQSLQEKFGIEPSERLAILGFNTRRLRELRGFVLQSSNQLQRTLVLRIPVERLVGKMRVGEERVSGSVRRELMKAAMYDFWQITGGSLHYNRIRNDTPFSIDGHGITLHEMFCANRAYYIADCYGRVGTSQYLNSGLFMLLLSHPRMATNRIFNSKKRENGGRFALGSQKVKEIIDMTEEIAQQDDWQFQLGLKIVETLVTAGLAPKAKGFWKSPKEQYTGVELVKWIQRIKMARDPDSTRAWGTSVINGYRREHGYGPNSEIVAQILALVGEIITSCQQHNMPLGDFSRTIASMDYYLLFYYNQKQTV